MGNVDVIVIGAGIAGLSAAYEAKKKGLSVCVIEKEPRIGGVIQSVSHDGYSFEMGPHTFLSRYTDLWNLADELGVLNRRVLVPSNVGNRRFIFRDNHLHPVEPSPKLLFSKLLSRKAKWRLMQEWRIPQRKSESDETVGDFVRRRVGDEFLRYLIAPMLSGIYAGNPDKLSMQAVFPMMVNLEKQYGGLIKALFKKKKEKIKQKSVPNVPCSFDNGIEVLIQALGRTLGDSILTGRRLSLMNKTATGWRVVTDQHGSTQTIDARHLILATPAHTAAALLCPISEALTRELSAIPYAPIMAVHTGFAKSDVPRPLDGFGFLVPRGEGVRILGSIWTSAMFPSRAPDGHILTSQFVGGMSDPEAIHLSDDELQRIVLGDLHTTMGIRAKPTFWHVTRYSSAIPQLQLGHVDRVKRIDDLCRTAGSLSLCGNYLSGVSVSDTIKRSATVVREQVGI